MTASRRCWWIRFECFAVLVALCVFANGGCSKPEAKVTVCPEPQITAEAAVQDVLAGLGQRKLVALWRFLPASFQNDVQVLIHDYGDRLDEQTWEPFVVTAQKARTVLSQLAKRSAESGDSLSEPDQQLVAQLQAFERIIGILSDSQLSSPAMIKRLDVEQLVMNVGDRVLESLPTETLNSGFALFGDVKVEQLETQGDSVRLSVQWPGQEPTQHRFVRVDDLWIPQTLAEAWPTEFPKVREQVLAWADELRSNPEPWHARLREIDQLLDELAATKSLAETRKVWQTGASRLAVAWLGLSVPEPPKSVDDAVETPTPVKPVRVRKPDTEVLLPDEPDK